MCCMILNSRKDSDFNILEYSAPVLHYSLCELPGISLPKHVNMVPRWYIFYHILLDKIKAPRYGTTPTIDDGKKYVGDAVKIVLLVSRKARKKRHADKKKEECRKSMCDDSFPLPSPSIPHLPNQPKNIRTLPLTLHLHHKHPGPCPTNTPRFSNAPNLSILID
jgi:hypothetical protein